MARFELSDGRAVPVTDGLTLGRGASCGVTLDDEKVSRKHARVVLEAGVAEVEDLGSRNGVFVNGHRVLRRMLRDGDVLTIGRLELRYVDDEATVPEGTLPAVGPTPGQDLLAGEDLLEEPVPAAEQFVARPEDRPAPPPRPAPAPVESPVDDVEVLEFVDEVVEVRKPARAAPPPTSAPRPATSSTSDGRRGVLQFSPNATQGVLGEDVGQLGGARRIAVLFAGVAIAAGAAWAAMTFVV